MFDYQTLHKKQEILKRFESELEDLGSLYPIEKVNKYVYIVGPKGSHKKLPYSFTAIIHSNEPSGLFVLLEFFEFLRKFKPSLDFPIGIALGNYEGFLANKRFIETDLNRSFNSSKIESLEQKEHLR